MGGYPPYPPPGPATPPPGYASAEDKTWALVAHFGGAAGTLISGGALAFVGPLVSYLARGNQSPVVREHARNALNFFVPVSALAVLLFVARVFNTLVIPAGLDLLISLLLGLVHLALWICGIVFGILAGVKANEGQQYRYPVSFPVVK